MQLTLETTGPARYLDADRQVDWRHPAIAAQARELFAGCRDDESAIRAAFEFVRDAIPHSWDIGSRRVTRTASEVLLAREGICYAKSMLLAALLRRRGIPTGFCYQRLTLGDTPDTGYCIHALNAVYLADRKLWMRIDARGNTNGKNAQFIPGREQLAFPVRPEYDEYDIPVIYAAPHPAIVSALENNTDGDELRRHGLPAHLETGPTGSVKMNRKENEKIK